MNFRVLMIALTLMAPATTWADDPATGGRPATDPAGLRPMQPWIAQLLADSRPQSPTLARLMRQVGARRIIVYIDGLTDPSAEWDGTVRFIGAAGSYRYLRVEIRQLSAPVSAAVLAHELRHVLEVAAADVTSREGFEALYRRIGTRTPGGPGSRYDTAAAVSAGLAALRELTGRRIGPLTTP